VVKLTLLFRQPSDISAFEEYYNKNLALLEKMSGIKRRQACFVLGSPAGKSPYYRILEFYFADRGELDTALLSPEGQAAGRNLMASIGRDVELIFSEVYED